MRNLPFDFLLGDLHGFILNDLSGTYSADQLVVNPNYAELAQVSHDFSFQIDAIPIGYNNLLIKAPNQIVLVDAGLPRPNGNLVLGLESLDLEPGAIDILVITHSDLDHIGGIVDPDGGLSFPNASYVLLADAWEYWSSRSGRAELTRLNNWTPKETQVVWEIYSQIKARLQVVEAGEEFVPGFRLYAAPGHRCDHSMLRVTAADQHLMHIADAISHPLFMANRAWYSTYDANPAQFVATKFDLLNKCAADQALVFGSHFPFPGLGYVHQDLENWRWQPIEAA